MQKKHLKIEERAYTCQWKNQDYLAGYNHWYGAALMRINAEIVKAGSQNDLFKQHNRIQLKYRPDVSTQMEHHTHW